MSSSFLCFVSSVKYQCAFGVPFFCVKRVEKVLQAATGGGSGKDSGGQGCTIAIIGKRASICYRDIFSTILTGLISSFSHHQHQTKFKYGIK